MAAQFGTSTSLTQRVNAGEAFDVAIMTTEAMEELGKSGKVSARHGAWPLGHRHRQPRWCEEARHRECRGPEEDAARVESRSPTPVTAQAVRTSSA